MADGEKLPVFDADGAAHKTQYAYDGFNRLVTTTFPDASTEQVPIYDADGNILAYMAGAEQTITESYDALTREVTKSLPASVRVKGVVGKKLRRVRGAGVSVNI